MRTTVELRRSRSRAAPLMQYALAMSEVSQPKFVVVAAVDRGPLSARVLETAFEAADRPGGELHIVGIAEPVVAPAFAGGAPYAVEFSRIEPKHLSKLAAETLAPALARRIEKEKAAESRGAPRKSPRVEVHTGYGSPANEIVWFAAHVDADLLVVGTAGRTGLARLLLGSVAEKLVRLAGCPVVVVRDKHHTGVEKIPEIEPLCPACAQTRFDTKGKTLWCARHSEHHPRAHAYNFSSELDDAPHASSATTGT